MNFLIKNTFEGGYSSDLDDTREQPNTYILGKNGRIYSENGVTGFASIKGTKLIYQNQDLVKFLGVCNFGEETMVFAKCRKPDNVDGTIEREICEKALFTESQTLQQPASLSYQINVLNEISANTTEIESCYTISTPASEETEFDIPYSQSQEINLQVDFGEYYKERFNVANYNICDINKGQIPIHNQLYYDTILMFSQDENGNLISNRIWTGAQNWPYNGKITAEGVEENQFYKRAYYSDALNPRRVVNAKDVSLASRKASEFNHILDNILLEPEVKSINDGGQVKAMKVMYVYRIISEQGQVSEFSPYSKFVDIIPETEAIEYRGGSISENTGKAIKVKVNLIDLERSSEVECIAIEFEASGSPTALRNLGIKKANAVVEFDHFGNESELADDVTIFDILEFKNTWKYCNDFTSKKNKLIAGGLRNNPTPSAIQNLEYLFPLHSWNSQGQSFDSLMNPEPWNYRYIDPLNKNELIYIKQKRYEYLASFGPAVFDFRNKATGATISKSFSELTLESYTNVIEEVIVWLLEEQANNPNFSNYFPNLLLSEESGKLLFSQVDENLKTDLSNYVFGSNNDQFIENFENNIQFLNPAINTSRLVHGAESIGFNQGNGVRVTYKEFKEPLLKQADGVYNGQGKLLDFETPSKEKYFMKGEIYRVGFQSFDNASSRYFVIPLGDLMIPEIGDLISSIDNQGNPVITSRKYINQSVEKGVLYGHGIKMHVEVRLSCEMQRLISMYQLVYVERTEDNRTILCQGIAAPLQRIQNNGSEAHKLPSELLEKWTLPYYGGPAYEKSAFRSYDEDGENYDYEGEAGGSDGYKRVIAHRGLMYFDSPDLYFNHISDQYISSSSVDVLAKLNTDHSPNTIMTRGDNDINESQGQTGSEIYPKFSRKIMENALSGDLNLQGHEGHEGGLPWYVTEEDYNITWESYFINISVFAKYQSIQKKSFEIDKTVKLKRGEIISGQAFNLDHDVSNNALALPCMPWYYSSYARDWKYQDGRANSDLFGHGSMTSPGYSTVVLKLKEDLFTSEFVGPDLLTVNPQMRLGGPRKELYDTYPLININRNNRVSVYGGRSEQAYSRNVYIPLSKTIPVSKNTGVQIFDTDGDTYSTLNIRLKNDAGDGEVKEIGFHNGGGGRDKGKIETWTRNGAWAYVNVLETQVEPKLINSGYEFWRKSSIHQFDFLRNEFINPAYFNVQNLKEFIPKPFKFKDDPNQGNEIAVSNVKLSGEIFDAWTVFKPNNFYAELEKNKGDVSNLVRYKNEVFAIQQYQTSLLYIGTDRIVNDAEGNPINVKQGSGTIVEGHRVLSDYGTKIRRNLSNSDFGFTFFDENKVELVKIDQPLLFKNQLHLLYWTLFRNNPITDSECFFDHQNKETVVRLRSSNGTVYTLSYNEAMAKFNGEYEMDSDLFFTVKEDLYAPVIGNPDKIHQLNEGDYLNLFGDPKNLQLKFVSHAKDEDILIYKRSEIITDIDYPVENILYETSLGQSRIVTKNHPGYRFREGNHSVPAKNESELEKELADLRGKWISVMITAKSKNKNKVNILAVNNALRKSHQ